MQDALAVIYKEEARNPSFLIHAQAAQMPNVAELLKYPKSESYENALSALTLEERQLFEEYLAENVRYDPSKASIYDAGFYHFSELERLTRREDLFPSLRREQPLSLADFLPFLRSCKGRYAECKEIIRHVDKVVKHLSSRYLYESPSEAKEWPIISYKDHLNALRKVSAYFGLLSETDPSVENSLAHRIQEGRIVTPSHWLTKCLHLVENALNKLEASSDEWNLTKFYTQRLNLKKEYHQNVDNVGSIAYNLSKEKVGTLAHEELTLKLVDVVHSSMEGNISTYPPETVSFDQKEIIDDHFAMSKVAENLREAVQAMGECHIKKNQDGKLTLNSKLTFLTDAFQYFYLPRIKSKLFEVLRGTADKTLKEQKATEILNASLREYNFNLESIDKKRYDDFEHLKLLFLYGGDFEDPFAI